MQEVICEHAVMRASAPGPGNVRVALVDAHPPASRGSDRPTQVIAAESVLRRDLATLPRDSTLSRETLEQFIADASTAVLCVRTFS